MITGMKRRITVTVDEGTFKALHLDSKNVSGYINELLQEKIIGTYREQLVDRMSRDIIGILLKDESFFQELTERIQSWLGDRYI